jgi:predicted type IV restriction endonuclease
MNVPTYPSTTLKTKEESGKKFIWDCVRRKYILLTPEEWVRQHLVYWLWKEKGFPLGLMKMEHPHKSFGLSKRSDVLVMNTSGSFVLLCECKASQVVLSSMHVRQALVYNHTLQAAFVLVTNGSAHVCLSLSHGTYHQIDDVPHFSSLL